jgi:hypothetical protein
MSTLCPVTCTVAVPPALNVVLATEPLDLNENSPVSSFVNVNADPVPVLRRRTTSPFLKRCAAAVAPASRDAQVEARARDPGREDGIDVWPGEGGAAAADAGTVSAPKPAKTETKLRVWRGHDLPPPCARRMAVSAGPGPQGKRRLKRSCSGPSGSSPGPPNRPRAAERPSSLRLRHNGGQPTVGCRNKQTHLHAHQ